MATPASLVFGPPDLIETLRFDPDEGLVALDRHLARMGASAAQLGLVLDRHAAANMLQAACFRCGDPVRVRLRLAPSGALAVEVAAAPSALAQVEVAIVPLPVHPEDPRLRHKTADRGFYDRARIAAGCFEVIFVRPDGRLTEGSFTNVFVQRGGRLMTPPLARGLLPGILRAMLLEEGRAIEGDLAAADLTESFLVGNVLRGLIPARLVSPVAAVAKAAL